MCIYKYIIFIYNIVYNSVDASSIDGVNPSISILLSIPTCSAPAWPATPRGISCDATGDDATGRTRPRSRPLEEIVTLPNGNYMKL